MRSKALLIGTTVAMSSPVMARPVNVFVQAENLGTQVIVGNHVYPKVQVGAGSASTEGQGGIIVTTGNRSTVREPIIGGNGLPVGSVCTQRRQSLSRLSRNINGPGTNPG